MDVGLVGFPGTGKSTVFNALTGASVDTGYGGKSKTSQAVIKVPDRRVDALATLFSPKKTIYAEIKFTDVGGGGGTHSLDRAQLNSMRDVDALCQVVRGFVDAAGDEADPVSEVAMLEAETILADLEIVERRVARLQKDRSSPRELELLVRIQSHFESEKPLRSLEISDEELRVLSGYRFLTLKPLLVVLNLAEEAIGDPPPALVSAIESRGLGLVSLSAQVEMEIAQLPADEQGEFLESLGLEEPAVGRFIAAAFELVGLISMLTAGPDECRAWPIRAGTIAQRAAGKIHSDIERGFIRAEVVPYQELIERGSEARCREAGVLRVEGKNYVIQDGDVVNFRFNV